MNRQPRAEALEIFKIIKKAGDVFGEFTANLPTFGNVQVSCCMGEEYEQKYGCSCGAEERVIRAYISGEYTEPMTQEQREWCLLEADWAGEGAFPREQAEDYSDQELARWMLNAWHAYAISQGL